jgi:hypothetical protein
MREYRDRHVAFTYNVSRTHHHDPLWSTTVDHENATRKIEEECAKRGKKIANRNAFQALLGLCGKAGELVDKLIFGKQDALDAERARVQMDFIIELLCSFDEAISNVGAKAKAAGADWTIFTGKVTAQGTNVEQVTGVYVSPHSGLVEFQTGTEILAVGDNTGSVTGLNIGGPPPKGKKK